MIYVVTEGSDPYVPGGRPIAAFREEGEAWNRLAEEVALDAWITWGLTYLRYGRTRDEVTRDAASVYDVTAVPLDDL